MNQKGQEGAAFRLLVEAVLVAFILVIILSIIGQIDQFRWQVSERRLFEGFDKAFNSPDGSVIVEKDLVLKNGASYSRGAFASPVTGMDDECVAIEASNSTAFSLTENKVVEITTIIQASVYYKCIHGEEIGEAQCPVYCTVGFGKDLSDS